MTLPPPATSGPSRAPLVTGLDLLTTRERDADGLAQAIAALLAAQGATAVTVATHWARAGGLRHVALSAEAAGIDPDVAWSVLCAALSGPGTASAAMLLGERYAGPSDLRPAVAAAVDAHITRSSGRVVAFPGNAGLTGTVPVTQVLASSGIDRVRVLAAGDANADMMITTRDHVRPRWVAGELVLDVQPAVGGTLVPFETPVPTPCCAEHA